MVKLQCIEARYKMFSAKIYVKESNSKHVENNFIGAHFLARDNFNDTLEENKAIRTGITKIGGNT